MLDILLLKQKQQLNGIIYRKARKRVENQLCSNGLLLLPLF